MSSRSFALCRCGDSHVLRRHAILTMKLVAIERRYALVHVLWGSYHDDTIRRLQLLRSGQVSEDFPRPELAHV
jgi:hypothetical protein